VTVKSIQRTALATSAVVLAALSSGCGDVARSGRSPAQIVIQSLRGIPGDAPDSAGGTLLSDVLSVVTTPAPCTTTDPCPTVFNDSGEVTMSLILKDPGQPGIAANPTDINTVTFTRYRVVFRRSDGRNTAGVDVPYPIDSAVTFTVPASGTVTAGFEIVRHSQKEEAPLRALRCAASLISTVADVSFYGRDQAGNDVSATGSIGITFGDVRTGLCS
jgi:hypothetical protein